MHWSDIPMGELILYDGFKNYFLPDKEENDRHPLVKKIRNINYQSGSLETIRKIIDQNGGLTLLPELACLYMGERRIKMVRPITDPDLTRTIIIDNGMGLVYFCITKSKQNDTLTK